MWLAPCSDWVFIHTYHRFSYMQIQSCQPVWVGCILYDFSPLEYANTILLKYLGLKYDFESLIAFTHNTAIRSRGHVSLKTEERLHNSYTTSHVINTYLVTRQNANGDHNCNYIAWSKGHLVWEYWCTIIDGDVYDCSDALRACFLCFTAFCFQFDGFF